MGTEERPAKPRQPGGIIIGLMLLLIGCVAMFAARGTQRTDEPSAVTGNNQKPQQPVLNEQSRKEAAQMTACAAIQKVVDGSMVFDQVFTLEPLDDGTSSLTTAALLNGRQVDVSAVLRWDERRQAWDVLEAHLGGAAVPVGRRAE